MFWLGKWNKGFIIEYYEKAFRRILPSKNAHNTLINELENSPFIEEQKLGKKLRNLRKLRNHADYNSKSKNLPVKKSKKDVEKIFSILEDLKNNPIRIMLN